LLAFFAGSQVNRIQNLYEMYSHMGLAAAHGIDPALLHRIAVISACTLDSLPQNGAVVTLLAVCGSTHRESYSDIVMAVIVGPIIALAAVIALGSAFGSF
jgi:H+/gluconate symporter-like permease